MPGMLANLARGRCPQKRYFQFRLGGGVGENATYGTRGCVQNLPRCVCGGREGLGSPLLFSIS